MLLNWVSMSGVVGARSVPARALARACGYQVAGNGADGKSRWTLAAPVLARTADAAVHDSGTISALTWIGTTLDSCAPQIAAACANTASRAAPSVLALFPPTGVKGVGSLRPCPAGSTSSITSVAARAPAAGTASRATATP